MEFVPPEDWPLVLGRFREALHAEGWLYLTVERAEPGAVREANAVLRQRGLPVVDGEVMRDEPYGYYHHYPTMDQVRAWIAEGASRSSTKPKVRGTTASTPTTTFWPAGRRDSGSARRRGAANDERRLSRYQVAGQAARRNGTSATRIPG